MNANRLTVIAAMIVVATASSLIPHRPNFTPLAAIAMFAGAHLTERRVVFLVAFGTLLVRDAILGFHILMPAVYACYAFSVWLGFQLRTNHRPWRVAGAALIGSTVFYIVTNFAVWVALDTYPHDALGLLSCYIAGIPLFRNTVASDLIYSMAMFGAFASAEARIPSLRPLATEK